jgi:hypothetical protein
MPYNGLLLSDDIDLHIPYLKGRPYLIHSPAESLETYEMEHVLATRGAILSSEPKEASLILIHRLYQPFLNYIPGLTEHKRRQTDILLFGSYLAHELVGGTVMPVFGSGITKIFPHGGIICFTIDHLLENPLHIKSILAFNVVPTSMDANHRAREVLGMLFCQYRC